MGQGVRPKLRRNQLVESVRQRQQVGFRVQLERLSGLCGMANERQQLERRPLPWAGWNTVCPAAPTWQLFETVRARCRATAGRRAVGRGREAGVAYASSMCGASAVVNVCRTWSCEWRAPNARPSRVRVSALWYEAARRGRHEGARVANHAIQQVGARAQRDGWHCLRSAAANPCQACRSGAARATRSL